MLLLASCLAWADDEASRVDVARELYAAFDAGDMPRILSLFSPEVEFIFHGPEHILPQAGVFKGREGVQDFFARIADNFQLQTVEQTAFSASGKRVYVPGWEEGFSIATGGYYRADWVHILTIEEGQIVRFEEVTDSGEIAEALAPADPERGKAYYTTCLACHGAQGEGNSNMHAPRLTLQEPDYIVRQLRHFRRMVRGGVQDVYGWQMNGRAAALPGDRALRDVAAYIDTLPDSYQAGEFDGDASSGERVYRQTCAACHGARAEGLSELQSPALVGLEGDYLLLQLENFASGLRGAHPDDQVGATMRAAMQVLDSAQAMKNVTSYIVSLAPAEAL